MGAMKDAHALRRILNGGRRAMVPAVRRDSLWYGGRKVELLGCRMAAKGPSAWQNARLLVLEY